MKTVVLLIAFSISLQAFGGHIVKQEASYTGKNAGPPAKFTWNVDGKKFRVDVQRGANSNSYVFNGRVFYSCGKLTGDQLTFLKSLKISASVMKSLKKGGCQQASTDFLIRFFLSPYDAIISPTVSDGMTANINLKNSKTSIVGSTSKVSSVKCAKLSRKYEINALKSGEGYKITESSCHAPSVKWRKAFSRELTMMLMRQPTARKYFQALMKDLKRRSGMTLTSKIKKTAQGAVTNISVKTLSVDKKSVPKKLLALPRGYKTFDAGNLAMLSKIKVKDNASLKSNGGGSDVANVLSFFLTGGNPAGTVMRAVNDNKESKN